jgi:putative OPT family oligopeptide transporter
VKATILGLVLAILLAGANAYLGMFAGLTVAAAIPAAVISMAVLRLWRDSNILENNMVQTIASAGEALAAGVIFTIPALVLLGYWQAFDYAWVTTIAGLGGLLGVLFTIPLRRALIVEQKLAYPEGTATAEVLKVGHAPGRGARALVGAALLGAGVKLAETGLQLWSGTAQAAAYVGTSTIAYIGTNLSPALLGVGYIVGLNVAALVFIGGVLSWYVAIPVYSTWFVATDAALAAQLAAGVPAEELAGAIWSTQVRYLGVGAMLIGGISALLRLKGSLLSGIKAGFRAVPAHDGAARDHRDQDVPLKLVAGGILLFVVPIAALYYAIVGTLGVALAMTLVMVAAGFLFTAVSGYMSGLVGSSNNPVSGITIATLLLTALLLLLMLGRGAAAGPAAAIMVGAVVCCAAAIGADTMQDLRAGYLLGATPWRQQVGQALGVVAAVLVMAPILNLLESAYGIGARTAEQPNALLAPQATLMASVARGVLEGGLPWTMIGLGVLVGAAILALDVYLERRRASFRTPVLAVAIGIYLPLELAVPIFAGGLIALATSRAQAAAAEPSAPRGLLFAAGLITGEALVGILMAVPIVVSQDPAVFALPWRLPAPAALLVVAAVGALLYRAALPRGRG